MVWAFVIVLLLLIPILVIVIDSQVGQALAERISRRDPVSGEFSSRLEALEAEVRYLSQSVESLREESAFLRSLVEGREEDPPRLAGGERGAEPAGGD